MRGDVPRLRSEHGSICAACSGDDAVAIRGVWRSDGVSVPVEIFDRLRHLPEWRSGGWWRDESELLFDGARGVSLRLALRAAFGGLPRWCRRRRCGRRRWNGRQLEAVDVQFVGTDHERREVVDGR